jgi:predicted amidohydrolase
MTENWMIAGVQMDPQLGAIEKNRSTIVRRLGEAAAAGARLIVFPECALTGYGFPDRRSAWSVSEELPGPSVEVIARACQERGVFCVFGLLEKDDTRLYNSCALIGPTGYLGRYRKVHLPCVGVDRFTDPGDEPFAVHDLGGLKIAIGICFDGSFPETARIQTLLGADLILLPTNWADKAIKMATIVPRVRAFENHVYHMAVNRVGHESGYHYIGHSSIVDYLGDYLAFADHDGEAILMASVSPADARKKKLVHCVGEYEIDRVNWRRPEMYAPLVAPMAHPFPGHHKAANDAQ